MSMISILFLLMTASTIVSSCNLTASEFDAVFADVAAERRADNYAALIAAAVTLGVEFVSVAQKAAFLGSVRFNTRDLASHASSCVDSASSCPTALYDAPCNASSATDVALVADGSRHYFPRSAMMIAFQCGYARVDAILAERHVVVTASAVSSPQRLSDDLYYSYLASLAVWIDDISDTDACASSSCLTMTTNSTSLFGACQASLNAWECTDAGRHDGQQRLRTIAQAGLALGSDFTDNLQGCLSAASPVTPKASPVTSKVSPVTSSPSPVTSNVSPVTSSPVTSSPMTSTTKPAINTTSCRSNVTTTASSTTCTCAIVASTTAASTTCSDTFPAPMSNASLACGIVTMEHFVDMFNVSDGDSVVDLVAQFNGLSTACSRASIGQLDVHQASFLLGAVAFYSGNLIDVGANVTDAFGFRGVMLMGGRSSYEAMTSWINDSSDMTCDLVANGRLVHDNIVLSWMSSLFFMEQTDADGRSVLQLASTGAFGAAVAVEDPMISAADQRVMFDLVRRASIVLGQEIATDVLRGSIFISANTTSSSSADDDEIVSGVTRPQPVTFVVMVVTVVVACIAF